MVLFMAGGSQAEGCKCNKQRYHNEKLFVT